MSEEQRAISDIVWTPERGLPTQEPEVRSILWNNFLTSDEPYFGRSRTAAEIRITPDTALQSTVVLACCRILAETIASLPIHVMRRTENGGKEVASDLPLYKVLSFAPNEWQTKFEFFEQVVMFLTLWGNSYSLIRSGRYGAVSSLDNLHPSRMEVERLENGRLRYIYSNPETGRIERYTQDQIMHVRWTPEPDGIKGMVPVEVAREAIALARACEIHASKYWANSARPGVVLQTDGTLSAEAAERLRDNWERLHRGVDRSWKTCVLTNGLKAEPLGFSQEQSQFIDSRRYQCEEIARVYRLPVALVQGQSTGNLETSGQEFVTYTLVPWLRRIESAISRSLIYNDDVFFAEFDTKALMRGDSNSRAAFYSTMTGLGIYSINDCRRNEGLAPIENGDKHFVAMNMQTLEDAVKPKPDPMAAMMGAPPPAAGGVPSLPEVKKGEAPKPSEPGVASQKKPDPIVEGDLVTWGDGKVGEVQHVMTQGTLDLKSGEKVEVKDGQPIALVTDASGEEFALSLAEIAKAPEQRSDDCGRQEGGRFGQGNKCASEDGEEPGSRLSSKEKNKAAKDAAKEIDGPIPADDKRIAAGKVPFSPTSSKNSRFASRPSDESVIDALSSDKKGKFGASRGLEEGYPVNLRIDIPTFNSTGVYAITVHEHSNAKSVGTTIGYDSFVRLSGPVTFGADENVATQIVLGRDKTPLAVVKGKFSKSREIPSDIDSWTAVGYDPKKAAYFYDKKTGDEIVGGVDAVSVGNSVFVREPKRRGRNVKVNYRDDVGFWGIEQRSDCGRQDKGQFGPGNDCAKEDGSSSDEPSTSGSSGRIKSETSERTFPESAKPYRDAVDSVVASSGRDPAKIWDRSKGKVETPPRQQIESFASEQSSQSGKPLSPEAEASYKDLVDEIGRQYEALIESGLRVSAWRGEGEPYGDPPGSTKPNSDKMRKDVAETGEFKFFMTERGFGTGAATPDHPMLRETSFKTSDGEPMIANDLFRVVHDLVAHVRGGYSFSTNGEYNGMLTHASTLPESAWPALFAETFGQNAVYELTGDFAPQNAYASKVGADAIRAELAKRKSQSRAEDNGRDSDEPLGYQHLKSRPWLMKGETAESRSGDCGRDEGGRFSQKNDCAADGSSEPAASKSPADGKSKIEKSKPGDTKSDTAWLSPSGEFHPVDRKEGNWGWRTHHQWARENGFDGGEKELFSKGWMRVISIGKSIYGSNDLGKLMTDRQKKSLRDHALLREYDDAVYDNGQNQSTLWRKDDRAFCATGAGGGIDNSCSSGSPGIKAGDVASSALEEVRKTGGFSIHPITAQSPTTGYMVSVVSESETVLENDEDITEKAIQDFFEKNKSHFESRPTLHLGGWIDQKTGKVYLDLSEQFASIDEAIDSAESTNQIAIWDLNEKKEIRKEDYDGRRTRPRQEARAVRLPWRNVAERARRRSQGSRAEDQGGAAEELISAAKKMFSSLPAIEIRSLTGPAAAYSHDSDTLYVSPDVSLVFEEGLTSQPNPVLHELSHRVHARSCPDSYEASSLREFTAEQRAMISQEVSRHAATNGQEFVAEVIAGVLSGHDYSDGVLKIFHELTGDMVSL